MNLYAIDVNNLHLSFGKYPALRAVDLKVPKGSAMALLGENGAGKTTTLRVLTGIYQAQQGTGSVLGKPLGCEDSDVFQRIGYVSENQELPKNWTLQKLINYLRPLYPTWDDEFCAELVEEFELPLDRKLSHMSRGMFMKVSLLSSMAYRPELLILDEPFSGLDPLVREELIDGILELMDGGDWTVILSSHDVHEVERLCDAVTILELGMPILSEPMDSLQNRYRKWTLLLEKPISNLDFPSDWLLVDQLSELSWTLTETQHNPETSAQRIRNHFGSIASIDSQTLSLRDIYLTLAKQKKRNRRNIRKQKKTTNQA